MPETKAKLKLSPETTEEEIEVFLRESGERLELMEEDIVKLEQGQQDGAVLEEIFRAAHTIKGISAMLGHPRMAELLHAMESLLEDLRDGNLEASPPLVDALFAGLDVAKVLREEVSTLKVSGVDVKTVMNQLQEVRGACAAKATQQEKQGSDTATLQIGAKEKKRIQEALEEGRRGYKVQVSLAHNPDLVSLRCFQVWNSLCKEGDVIASNPTEADMKEDNVTGFDVALIYYADEDEQAIRQRIGHIPDIVDIKVSSYDLEGKKAERDEPSAAQESPQPQALSEDAEVSKFIKYVNLPPQCKEDDALPKAPSLSFEAKTSQTVRIDVQRLDDLMNMVGELAIFQPRILQISRMLEATYRDDERARALAETSTNALKIVNELQEDIMRIRMLPIGVVFSSFPRMVRDLARKAGKDINFVVEGQDTEVDRTVVDHLRDPIMHLLRNAVDHGIEAPQVRAAAGKPPKGMVRLSAKHEEGHIVICSEDDGGGVNPAMVKKSAVKRGIITNDAAAKMTDAEAIELIFAAGLSTAEKATDVSGRGVGLDVVKKNIEVLNGVVMVDTDLGKGTKFVLRMPLTLATFQGLLVSTANTTMAIPLVSVTETLKLSELETITVNGSEVVRVRDNLMPLIRLGRTLHFDGVRDNEEEFIVVVRDGSRQVSFAVDSVMEPQEVVVKSLGSCMGEMKGIAGASILGDGTVALIVDAPTVIRAAIARQL